MTDLISRADAIEAVRSYFKDRLGKSKCDYDEELQVYVLGKEERILLTYNKGINDKLRSLPSAELTLQTSQTYGKSINPSNAEVVEDLISRADAIEAVASEITEERSVMNCGLDMAIKIIKALPSADAVPIVYCMDCAKSVPLDEHGALWKCKAHDRTTLRHSYCNNGERKGGDTE